MGKAKKTEKEPLIVDIKEPGKIQVEGYFTKSEGAKQSLPMPYYTLTVTVQSGNIPAGIREFFAKRRDGVPYVRLTVEEIQGPDPEPEENPEVAKGCTSGRHNYHEKVPWMHGHPYDMHCLICNEPAAWAAGANNEVPMCDCHAEDWGRWFRDKRPVGNGRKKWWAVFNEFKAAVLAGEFAPNDFKEEQNGNQQ